MRTWTDTWLKTKGLSILTPVITPSADGKTIDKFEVVQTFEANSDEVYRSQKIDIAYYDNHHNDNLVKSVLIKDQEITEIEELKGLPLPAGVFLNANNFGYCKVGFDQKSVAYFRDHTQEIKSDINRNLIYRYMWEFYKANKIEAKDYLVLAKNCLNSESSMHAVSFLLNTLVTQVFTYEKFGKGREALISECFDLIIELFKLKTNKQDSNLVATYVISFIPSSKLAYEFLKNNTVVDKHSKVLNADFQLTTSQKHTLLCHLFADEKGCEEGKSLRTSELIICYSRENSTV